MNIQTLTNQLQTEGLTLKARYTEGRFNCTIKNQDGLSISESSGIRLPATIFKALDQTKNLAQRGVLHPYNEITVELPETAPKEHVVLS